MMLRCKVSRPRGIIMNSVRSEINLRTRAAIAGLDRRIGRDFTGSAIEPKRKRCASNATLDVLLTPRHFYGLRAVGEICAYHGASIMAFNWQSKIENPPCLCVSVGNLASQVYPWVALLEHCHETRFCLSLALCFSCGWLRAAEQRSGHERSEGDPSPPGEKPGRCRRGDACGQIRLQTHAAADELCPPGPAHDGIEQLPLRQGWRRP